LIYKILVIAANENSFQFILQNLKNPTLQIQLSFRPLKQINRISEDLIKIHLIIADMRHSSREEIMNIFKLRKSCLEIKIPIIAIVAKKTNFLRRQILENGIDDYLIYPFEDIDLEFKINRLLQSLKSKRGREIEHLKTNETFHYINRSLAEFNKILLQGNGKITTGFFLEKLKSILNAEHLFYFQITNKNSLILHKEISAQGHLNEEIGEVTVSDLPLLERSIDFREPLLLDNLSDESLIATHLNAFLNVHAKSLIIYPLKDEELNESLILLTRSNDSSFSQFDYLLGQSVIQLYTQRQIIENNALLKIENSKRRGTNESTRSFSRWVLNHLDIGIIVVNNNYEIKLLNTSAENILNISLEKSLNKPLEGILSEEIMDEIFQSGLNNVDPFGRQFFFDRGNGEKVLLEYSIQQYQSPSSNKEGFIVSIKDTTFTHEIQEEMQRVDRLASLGVMASGIAHEIRNPLAGIKAIAQTLEEELEETDPKNEYVTRIIKQVNRLDELLKSLFSYARPMKPNRHYWSILNILEDVITLIQPNLKVKKIQLFKIIQPNLPKIYADNAQIQQVLINLLLNSIEAILNKGEIKIVIYASQTNAGKFSRKPFHEFIRDKSFIIVEISDNGSGISQDHLKQIFNPFFTTKPFGTGLGLSIVYQIVKENNGIVFFESEKNKGTCCFLFLPCFNIGKYK
jgi:nitrogen-specific signal transduction histidine kinase/DNA-binding response OmpR family regulator